MIKEVFGLALSMGCIVMMERQLLTLKGNRLTRHSYPHRAHCDRSRVQTVQSRNPTTVFAGLAILIS
jgi:hypothetical protein